MYLNKHDMIMFLHNRHGKDNTAKLAQALKASKTPAQVCVMILSLNKLINSSTISVITQVHQCIISLYIKKIVIESQQLLYYRDYHCLGCSNKLTPFFRGYCAFNAASYSIHHVRVSI